MVRKRGKEKKELNQKTFHKKSGKNGFCNIVSKNKKCSAYRKEIGVLGKERLKV